MIIVMKPSASNENVSEVSDLLKKLNLDVHVSKGSETTIIGVIGDKRVLDDVPLVLMPGVQKIVPIMDLFKLASKTFKPEQSTVDIDGVKIGGEELAVIAGPCAVENREQLLDTAKAVKASGAKLLRGGAYKPRTSPYSFQGLEEEALKYMAEARELTGLKIVTEVISEKSIETAYKYVDMFQIGARNMQNFYLLREVGKTQKPVLLKRGLSATIEEWLNAAEYIINEGNYNVILCERGIRTFETATRNTLDISSIPVIKTKTHLPILVDPSHAAGNWEYIIPLTRGVIAAGADGVIVEVHPNPKQALSDGPQSLTPKKFDELCDNIKRIAPLLDRKF